MTQGRLRFSRANILVAVFLIVGLILGIGLVTFDGSDEAPTEGSSSANSSTLDKELTAVTLPLSDLSASGVTKLTGLVFPKSMSGFLTAKVASNSQLDITFVMPSTAAAAFVDESALPELQANQRLIMHSSPMWKVNPSDGSTVASTQDDHRNVHRVVELVTGPDDGAGNTRARIVITPS